MQTRKRKQKHIVQWKAQQSGGVYAVTLDNAAETDMCSILHEDIATAALEWLPAESDYFVKHDRALRMASLPCGHSFYVMALLYHFRSNQMRCPVCRSGEDNIINAQNIPRHLLRTVIARADEMRKHSAAENRAETEQMNADLIQQIIAQDSSRFFTAYVPTFHIYATVHSRNSPVLQCTIPLLPSADTTHFEVDGGILRHFADLIRERIGEGGFLEIDIGSNNICIARTRRISLPLTSQSCAHDTAVFTPFTTADGHGISTPTLQFSRAASPRIVGELKMLLTTQTCDPFAVQAMSWTTPFMHIVSVINS